MIKVHTVSKCAIKESNSSSQAGIETSRGKLKGDNEKNFSTLHIPLRNSLLQSVVRIRNSEALRVRCGYGNWSAFHTASTIKCFRRDVGLTVWSSALPSSEISIKSSSGGEIQAWMDQSSDSAPQGPAHHATAYLLCFCGVAASGFF